MAALTFEIVPAIDLRGGHCVRLRQGEAGTETTFSEDPLAVARRFAAAGASRLHLIDLDGAFDGKPRNEEPIRAVLEAISVPLQVGGGLRDLATVERVLALGARWAILGTAALRDPELVAQACARFPGRVAVAIDARAGKVAASGWTEVSEVGDIELGERLAQVGVSHFIYTAIERDGMLAGPDIVATRRFAGSVGVPVLASGGVASMSDLGRLFGLAAEGVSGAVVGRAIYTGAIDLAQAIDWVRGARAC
jgi:phosphoribosylformimino-5-aminoimidazole carboxamide ribotide isomerase